MGVQDLVLVEARRRLLRLLVGLDLGCVALHLATLALAWAQGGALAGTADAALLGVAGPLQLGALSTALLAAAAREACRPLAFAGLAAGLLSAGDLASLPARLGDRLAGWSDLSVAGLSTTEAGKLLAGAALATILACLVWRAHMAGGPRPRRIAGVLARTILAFVLVDLALDLSGALADGGAKLVLDLLEESMETLVASWALADCLVLLPGPGQTSQNKTKRARRYWNPAMESQF